MKFCMPSGMFVGVDAHIDPRAPPDSPKISVKSVLSAGTMWASSPTALHAKVPLLPTSVTADRQRIVVCALLNAFDLDIIAVLLVHLHQHALARLVAHDSFADRRLLADETLEGVLPERRNKLDGLLLVVLLNIDDNLVKSPISPGLDSVSMTFAVLIMRSK